MKALNIDHLSVTKDNFALKIKELSLNNGDKLALLGENGAGKSTLFNVIAKINPHYQGKVRILGKNLEEYTQLEFARKVAYLPQFFDLIFGFSVFETVLLGRYPQTQGRYGQRDYQLTAYWLEKLHLLELKQRKFQELSGGEKKRVMLARVLNQDSSIVFLDEPFAMLDVKFVQMIKKILGQLNKTIICSAHDFNQIKGFCSRVVFLKQGKIFYQTQTNQIKEEVLKDVFEVDFIKCSGYFVPV